MTNQDFRAPWQPNTIGWDFSQVKNYYEVILGKMLQNTPAGHEDIEVPYFKAQHVQWNNVVIDELPTMWASPSEIEMLSIKKGDLLVCEGGEAGRAGIVHNEPPVNTIIQNAIHLVRPKRNGDIRYLRYLLQHAASHGWLDVICNRATIAHFTVEKFNQLWAWFPSLTEQCAIADYLDRETAQIDTLISAKERLLELLAEKRRAVITHAVTRGLNPDTSLRDSGVDWLRDVPIHWEVEYARWLFNEVDERSTEHGEEELLSVSHLTGVTARADKEVNMFLAESNEGYKICRQGDLVINTLWAWMGAMGIAFQDGIVSPAYNVYRLREKYIPEYIDILARIPIFAQEVTRFSRGVWSSRLRLYPEEFFKVQMPVPPLSEQREIVEHVKSQTEKIDRLSELAQKTIEHLRERRASLIAAVVSGQIKVV